MARDATSAKGRGTERDIAASPGICRARLEGGPSQDQTRRELTSIVGSAASDHPLSRHSVRFELNPLGLTHATQAAPPGMIDVLTQYASQVVRTAPTGHPV